MQRIERLLYLIAACLTLWAFTPSAGAASKMESSLYAADPIPIDCDGCYDIPIPDETNFFVYVGSGQGAADAWNALYNHFTTRYLQFIDCRRDACNEPEGCMPFVTLSYSSVHVTATGEPFEFVASFVNGEIHLCCTSCLVSH